MRRLSVSALAAVIMLPLSAVSVATATTMVTAPPAAALDNGLAKTPPMGFNNWNSTHCRAEFNEDMVKGIADLFVSSGLEDAGYEYVNIDDCWAEPQRDADGNLVPNHTRFPSGIKPLADYVHAKGLKFGIYTSAGTRTCDKLGFPGGLDHEEQDARLFASWGVDYLKYDNCNNQGRDAVERYTKMRDALAATGRPIVFSICEWGESKPWLWASDVGNLWRTTGDISDNWASMLSIVHKNMPLAPYAKPGAWNDPDMLEVGNGGMTQTEYRSHFSLWSVMAAPLLIGSDLRKATPETMDILLNKEIIAVDQDPLGKQGTAIRSEDGHHVFVKPLANGDVAIALFNETGQPATIPTTAAEAGLPAAPAYHVRDLWAHTDRETAGVIQAHVPAHGTAMFRLGPDPRWALYPPAVDLSGQPELAFPGAAPVVRAGATTTVTTVATNNGLAPARKPHVELHAPEGWTVAATSANTRPELVRDETLTTTWSVTVPDGTARGTYPLTGEVSYLPGNGDQRTVSSFETTVVVPPPPPHGTAYLSDVQWLSTTNGWGPVELDRSNGERKATDGRTITINGVEYAKGIGAHAPSTIEYFTGRSCSSITADVGVDDEKSLYGTVTFEIWADDHKVADSGVMDTTMPAKTLAADVSGATLVRLTVTDAGDGINSDHADWAGAQITCA